MRRRFVISRGGRGFVAAASVLVLAACSSSTDDPGTTGGAGGKGATGGDIYAKIGTKPPDPAPDEFIYSDVKAPYDDAAGCKAFESETLPADFHPDVRQCSCDNCFDLQQQCDALQGCQEILKCGIEINCSDAYSCYLAPVAGPLDPDGKGCVSVIDPWGNSGVSSALSLALGKCSTENHCR